MVCIASQQPLERICKHVPPQYLYLLAKSDVEKRIRMTRSIKSDYHSRSFSGAFEFPGRPRPPSLTRRAPFGQASPRRVALQQLPRLGLTSDSKTGHSTGCSSAIPPRLTPRCRRAVLNGGPRAPTGRRSASRARRRPFVVGAAAGAWSMAPGALPSSFRGQSHLPNVVRSLLGKSTWSSLRAARERPA